MKSNKHYNIMEYTPKPINTGNIKLPEEIEALSERMAEHVHETWAATRICQGWTYAPKRNDTLKQHPCLIPYKDLPDEEKIYDKSTAIATLKLIISLGYEIVRVHK